MRQAIQEISVAPFRVWKTVLKTGQHGALVYLWSACTIYRFARIWNNA